MVIFESIDEKVIRIPLKSKNKKDVIPEMVKILKDAGTIKDAKSVVKDVLQREGLSSTGLGGGIAIPHTKTILVDKLAYAIGISPRGIDFDSLDDELVHIFFLILSHPDRSGEHLQTLSAIANVTKDKIFCEKVIAASSVKDVIELFTRATQS